MLLIAPPPSLFVPAAGLYGTGRTEEPLLRAVEPVPDPSFAELMRLCMLRLGSCPDPVVFSLRPLRLALREHHPRQS